MISIIELIEGYRGVYRGTLKTVLTTHLNYFQTIYTLPLDKTSKWVYNIHIEYLQEFLGVYISLLFISIL